MRISQSWKKCLTITVIIVTSLILTFFLIFLGIPLSIQNSEKLQRHFVFPTDDLQPENPDYGNVASYNVIGGRNLYVYVSNDSSVYLGVWHLLPHHLANLMVSYQNFTFEEALLYSDFPVLMYFHANGGNRIKFVNMYHVLRNFFHIIAFDYRGYGDSSPQTPTEVDIVHDSVNLYKWIRTQTQADIYLWGHGVGAALSAHTVVSLQKENLPVKGLFFEAPFTTIQEQIKFNPFYKFFSWLPWYKATMIDSLVDHGFVLNTTDYLLSVDCCIMIVHAKDDRNSPARFSEELYRVVQSHNKPVTLHLLPEHLRCGHYSIRKAPQLSGYISDTIRFCKNVGLR